MTDVKSVEGTKRELYGIENIPAAAGTAALFYPQLDKDVLSIIQEYILIEIDVPFLNEILKYFTVRVNASDHLYAPPREHDTHEIALYQARDFTIDNEDKFQEMIKTHAICSDINTFAITMRDETTYNEGNITVIERSPSVRFTCEGPLYIPTFLSALKVWSKVMSCVQVGCQYTTDYDGIYVKKVKHIIDERSQSVLIFYMDFG